MSRREVTTDTEKKDPTDQEQSSSTQPVSRLFVDPHLPITRRPKRGQQLGSNDGSKRKKQSVLAASSSSSFDPRRMVFNNSRPATRLPGGAQGDHTTAFALLKKLITKCYSHVENQGKYSKRDGQDVKSEVIESATKNFLHKLDTVFPDINSNYDEVSSRVQPVFEKYKKIKADNIFTEEQRVKVVGALENNLENSLAKKVLASIGRDQFRVKEEFVIELAEHLLIVTNKGPLTIFPRHPNQPRPPDNEGALVKGALSYLDKLEKEIYETVFDKDNFIKPKTKDIVKHMCDLLWYPLIDISGAGKSSDEKSSKYDRGNDYDLLCQVIERHLAIVFETYPYLIRDHLSIATEFIGKFITDQSWSTILQGEEQELITQCIVTNLGNKYGLKRNTPDYSRGVDHSNSSVRSGDAKEHYILAGDSIRSEFTGDDTYSPSGSEGGASHIPTVSASTLLDSTKSIYNKSPRFFTRSTASSASHSPQAMPNLYRQYEEALKSYGIDVEHGKRLPYDALLIAYKDYKRQIVLPSKSP